MTVCLSELETEAKIQKKNTKKKIKTEKWHKPLKLTVGYAHILTYTHNRVTLIIIVRNIERYLCSVPNHAMYMLKILSLWIKSERYTHWFLCRHIYGRSNGAISWRNCSWYAMLMSVITQVSLIRSKSLKIAKSGAASIHFVCTLIVLVLVRNVHVCGNNTNNLTEKEI